MFAHVKLLIIVIFEFLFKRNAVRYEIYKENNDYYLKKFSEPIRSPKNEEEVKLKFLSHKKFSSITALWNYITRSEKWFVNYHASSFINTENYIEELAPFIVKTTNNLRKNLSFSEDDTFFISLWNNLIHKHTTQSEFMLEQSKLLKTYCANCSKPQSGFNLRYPKSICHECRSFITDENGRKVEFFNSEGLGFGCQGYYSGTNQQEKYDADVCFIQEKKFIAQEAKFGGIVISLKE